MNKDWFLVGATLLSGFLLVTGCSFINAPSEVKPGEGTGGAGGGLSSSSSSASSSSGMAGSGGGMACEPGTQMPCYDGTPGTAGTGECRSGMATCLGDGTGYGACEGQVVNAAMDICATPLLDENCDGVENDGCLPEQLAIVAAAPLGYADEVRTLLMGTGRFAVIDVYDASVTTPMLANLETHQSVLVFSDKVFMDPVGLGNVLADYYDGGGRVVVAQYATITGSTCIQGRFGDPANGYMLLDPTGITSMGENDGLGTVNEPQSPLMRDVSMFAYALSTKSTGKVINTGVVVAEWAKGLPLIIRGTVQGRNRVDLNFFPPQTQGGNMVWGGDGVAMLRNALLF